MTSIKNRLPWWGWLIVLGLPLLLGALIVLHFTGRIDLVALSGGAYLWIVASPLDTALTIVLTAVISFVAGWQITKYFIGIKSNNPLAAPGYAPAPTYPSSQPQQKSDTVIS